MNNLGTLYQAMGDYRRAEPLLRRATEILENAVGEEHPDYAGSLNNLAVLYQDMGDHRRAEPLLRQAMEILEKAVGEDRPDYASSLNNLGALYRERRDYPRAEPLLRRAMEIRKKALGEDHSDYASSLNNLGTLYQEMGDYRRAEPLLERAMEIRKKAVGEDHPDYAISLNNLGTLYGAMGDYRRRRGAPPPPRRRRSSRRRWGRSTPSTRSSLSNMGVLYRDMGEARQAEPLLRRGVGESAPGAAPPPLSLPLPPLPSFHQSPATTHDPGKCSWSRSKRAIPSFKDTAPVLGERPRLELLRSVRVRLDDYLDIAQQIGTSPEALYRWVLDWKRAVMTGHVDDRLARDSPELRPVLEELASVRARLACQAFTVPAPVQRDIWRKQLAALREHKEILEAELGGRSAILCATAVGSGRTGRGVRGFDGGNGPGRPVRPRALQPSEGWAGPIRERDPAAARVRRAA